MQCSIKVDKVLSAAEAADFLRRLADGLEKGRLIVGDTTVDMGGSIQVAELLEVQEDKVLFDLKVEYRADSSPAQTGDDTRVTSTDSGGSQPGEKSVPADREAKPTLKKLKKRMATSLKGLLDQVQAGELPKLEAVASFCEDADLMTSVMKKGKKSFPQFTAQCKALLEAVEKESLENTRNALGDINQSRKDCHAHHK